MMFAFSALSLPLFFHLIRHLIAATPPVSQSETTSPSQGRLYPPPLTEIRETAIIIRLFCV